MSIRIKRCQGICFLYLLVAMCTIPLQAQRVRNSSGFEQSILFQQLNSSLVNHLWGVQSKTGFLISDRMELLNTVSFLAGAQNDYFVNDLRICLFGPPAENWRPGLGFEVGYLYMSRDFLVEENHSNQHGFLFGGDWYFPLEVLSQGYVVAKWAYVIRPGSSDQTVFNCFVHWNLTGWIGFYAGGDIYTKFKALKYSGFVAGFTFRIKNNRESGKT